ncbi:MAG TPA: alpha/beta fold hydrolase, partial [Chroococcidiopsis sp.]
MLSTVLFPQRDQPAESNVSKPVRRLWQRRLQHVLYGGAIALGVGLGTPAYGAERVAVRVGPLQQSVAIADLELYVKTGEISAALRPYSMVLSDDLRQALNSRLQLDPKSSDKLIGDLLQSSAGERLLNLLDVIVADSEPEDVKTALTHAAKEADGLSLLGVLKAYPRSKVTLDGVSAIALASQLNLPYWQSQSLSSILERELTVETTQPVDVGFDPTKAGNHWVRQQSMILRDYTRNRSIPVDLYWSRRTDGPLIVISHGFGADRRFLGYLAYHLASHGFAVAALEHPGSNVTWLTDIATGLSKPGDADILPATEFIDRPKDVSFMLDQLKLLNEYSLYFRGKLNTNQVVVIGHSLGGYTALALAGADLDLAGLRDYCSKLNSAGVSPSDWAQCTAADLPGDAINFRDPRVVQVLAFNPIIGHLFNNAGLASIKVPVLMLASSDDTIVPAASQQLLPFTALRSPKYLLTAIGSTHLSVGDPANLNYALTESLFVRERRGDETNELRELTRGLSLAFIKQVTPDAEHYTQFLTPEYVQSFSTA